MKLVILLTKSQYSPGCLYYQQKSNQLQRSLHSTVLDVRRQVLSLHFWARLAMRSTKAGGWRCDETEGKSLRLQALPEKLKNETDIKAK